jgi:hypothetical protein
MVRTFHSLLYGTYMTVLHTITVDNDQALGTTLSNVTEKLLSTSHNSS